MYFTEEGKIAFDKNERNQKNLSFKRAQYMLYDVKYVTFDENIMYLIFTLQKYNSQWLIVYMKWLKPD